MSASGAAIKHQRLRAPSEPNSAIVEPPLSSVASHLADNRSRRRAARVSWFGVTTDELAAEARRQLVRDALRYTSAYRDTEVTGDDLAADSLLLTGHQPELFHPGVWFKNFVLSQLAGRHGALGIHLLTDHDLLRSSAIRVPSGSLNAPCVANEPLDRSGSVLPFEERQVLDDTVFASFARRVEATIRPFVERPLAVSLWPFAQRAVQRGRPLGAALAEARHSVEASWGLNTLELPMSVACDTESFRRFTLFLLANLEEYRTIHNEAIREYRRVHRLRSQSHPVPCLAAEDDWLETPFWCWRSETPQRRPLLSRRVGGELQLRGGGTHPSSRSGSGIECSLEIGVPDNALGQLAAARHQGFKIRPRALTTTMYMRLILSDLFLHGIGGAEYDQLTDAIMARFLGVQPPEFLTLSATVRLPISYPPIADADIRSLDVLLRELWYHPERHLERATLDRQQQAYANTWKDEKFRAISAVAPREQAAKRHRKIEEANDKLRELLKRTRRNMLRERECLVEKSRHARLLSSREFSFCLFPDSVLCQRLLDLAGPPS